MPPTEVIVASIARDRRQFAADLLALTKPRVVVIKDNCPNRKAETVFRAKAFCRYEVVDYKPAKKKKAA